ncbi:mtDNA inheritance, partitioning of the mitochondrial organelle [Physocladia obscura]|uniref:MtDNA inheritance, partitioning of the mitochondrial organelle n=1 Tax=Physocladia obscura TaxID=109957 RepID=A0AAD5X7N4_9FUNG|nr:mtDNA inheritance, partitioning of the mitochondrial organelle [Physocladia obscura]
MREIVTLQLGHSASFVGTHLWNALDIADPNVVDSSVLIRSGFDADSGVATYAPRLVIVDLKGTCILGTLKRINQLYESEQDSQFVAWNGKVDVRKQEPVEKNEYLTYLDQDDQADHDDNHSDNHNVRLNPQQQKPPSNPPTAKQFSKVLDSVVHVWSDFNSMFYHPRSVLELPSYSHNDNVTPFAIFNQGSEIWDSDRDLQEDILDNRIRFFLEECDNPQGIQVLSDVSNGFSGFTASCLESLREDVGKLSITVFGVSDDCDGVINSVQNFNEALALANISKSASVYIPLQSRYQWTAALAVAIDTITLPMRLNKSSTSMGSFMAPLIATGPLGTLASSTPFPFDSNINAIKRMFAKTIGGGNFDDERVDWIHDDTFGDAFDLVFSRFIFNCWCTMYY